MRPITLRPRRGRAGMTNMNNIGKTICDFFCNGFFGRRYDNDGATIEAEGKDWVVIRYPNNSVNFAVFEPGLHNKQDFIDKWCSPQNEE